MLFLSSFLPVKKFFSWHGKFILTRNEGQGTEDVIHCTDCLDHWGNVIVILGYVNQNLREPNLTSVWTHSKNLEYYQFAIIKNRERRQ